MYLDTKLVANELPKGKSRCVLKIDDAYAEVVVVYEVTLDCLGEGGLSHDYVTTLTVTSVSHSFL